MLLAFTACRNGGQQAPAATGQEPEAAAAVEVRSERPNVAYIQIDSLMLDYLLAQDLSNAFQAKANKAERELNAKSQQLEKDMLEAQDKIQKGLVTRATAEEMQQKLMQQQQELLATRDRMMGELAEEEQVMNNRIYYAVMDYLKYDRVGAHSPCRPRNGYHRRGARRAERTLCRRESGRKEVVCTRRENDRRGCG